MPVKKTVVKRKVSEPPPIVEQPIPPETFHKKYFWWLAGFCALVIIILLFVIFSHKKPVDTKNYDALNKAYNDLLQVRADERKVYEANKYNDSIDIEKYKNEKNYYLNLANKNAAFYKANENKIHNAPVTVPVISNKDSLRAAIKNNN